MGCSDSKDVEVKPLGLISTAIDGVRGLGGTSVEAIKAEGVLDKQQLITHGKSQLGKAVEKKAEKAREEEGRKGAEAALQKQTGKETSSRPEAGGKDKEISSQDKSKSIVPEEVNPVYPPPEPETPPPQSPAQFRAAQLFEAERLDVDISRQDIALSKVQLTYDILIETERVTVGFTRRDFPRDWSTCQSKVRGELETALYTVQDDCLHLREVCRQHNISPTDVIAVSNRDSLAGTRQDDDDGPMARSIAQGNIVTAAMQQEIGDLQEKLNAADAISNELKQQATAAEARNKLLREKLLQKKAANLERSAAAKKQQQDAEQNSARNRHSSVFVLSAESAKSFLEQISHVAVAGQCSIAMKQLVLKKMCQFSGCLDPASVVLPDGTCMKSSVADMTTISFQGNTLGDSLAVLIGIVLQARSNPTAKTTTTAALPGIASISLGACGLTDTGAMYLGLALSTFNNAAVGLKEVLLVGNSVGAQGLVHILGAVLTNPSIESLTIDLTSNPVNEDPAMAESVALYMGELRRTKKGVHVEMPPPPANRRSGSVVKR